MANTPTAGAVSTVVTGGTAVIPVPALTAGGAITNPTTAATPLYVNPAGTASTTEGDTTFALWPGQTFNIIPDSTLPVSVNAIDDNHEFCCYYLVAAP